ncbi:MAG: alpha/beta fold hydrolase [Rhodobacteraceae bacterium]|nr:alpha/beta fold hydrolase [Paracoccaceae bacterium]
MSDFKTFDLSPLTLQCGITLPKAHLAYQTYGQLNADKSNLVLYPTSYGAQHTDIEWLIGPGRILDPERFFVVIPNQLGNGLSTSPSSMEGPFAQGRSPRFSHWDNIHAQERLLREVFGVTKIPLGYGWSMGGQQLLHWGAIFPDRIERICATCTSARTSPHNQIFLQSLRETLTTDPAWRGNHFAEFPVQGLRAFSRIYASWAMSQAFYRAEAWREAGFTSLEDYLVRAWEGNYMRRDPLNLLSMIDTWYNSDISNNEIYNGDLDKALGAIEAKAIILPSTTDLYFTVADSEIETAKLPNAELRLIDSIWGHRAGNPEFTPDDEAVLRGAVEDLMAS